MHTSRVQLALNVTDLDAATAFYSELFGTGPAKQRPGYANFEVADPPLGAGPVREPERRFAAQPSRRRDALVRRRDGRRASASPGASGLADGVDRCCHAVQDKIWVGRARCAVWRVGVLHRVRRRHREARAEGTSVCCTSTGSSRRRAAPDRRCDVRDTAVLVDGLHVRFVDVCARGRRRASPCRHNARHARHNGAGKTTLIRVLATLARPTAGRVEVDGLDVVADAAGVRRRIGVTGQYAGLDEFLTAPRTSSSSVGFSPPWRSDTAGRRPRRALRARRVRRAAGRRTLGQFTPARRPRGQPRRLTSVLFLDETTTGLDPMARAALWDVVENLTANGTTVVLTTQYLEEADRLADSVVALSTPSSPRKAHPPNEGIVGGKVVAVTVAADALHAMPTGGTTGAPQTARARVLHDRRRRRPALILREITDLTSVHRRRRHVTDPGQVVAHVATGASA